MAVKRALLFGAAGFVGPYLAKELLKEGYEVYGVDNKPIGDSSLFSEFFIGNILDEERVTEIVRVVKPSHIVNLAAISSVGLSWKIPAQTLEVNVCGPIHIFESCLKVGIKPRILLVGSSEEYAPSSSKLSERSPIIANNPYGISKGGQESFASIYRERYGFEVLCTRSFNHTGIGQADSFVLPTFCKQVAAIEAGLSEPIVRVGNLAASRDFSDVRDVVRAYAMILEKGKSGSVYNVGSGNAYRLKDLLDKILSFSGKKIQVVVDPEKFRPVDNPLIVCDHKKITNELGWNPCVEIKETLFEMFSYYLKLFSEVNL